MAEYISREETVKKIEEKLKVDDLMSLAEEVWTDNCLKIVLKTIMAVESADVQPVPQWISAKERLPEENQKCLVYRDINADLKITTGIWHSEWKAFDGLRHGTRLEDTITWMPLPEPPKDGDTNE